MICVRVLSYVWLGEGACRRTDVLRVELASCFVVSLKILLPWLLARLQHFSTIEKEKVFHAEKEYVRGLIHCFWIAGQTVRVDSSWGVPLWTSCHPLDGAHSGRMKNLRKEFMDLSINTLQIPTFH